MTCETRTLLPGAGRLVASLLMCLCMTAALLPACASTPSSDEAQIAELGPDDKLYEFKTVSRQFRAHPQAAEVARELDLVDVWLVRAERLIADDKKKDDDEKLLELQLLAIEGQLVEIGSHFARREAELKLESSRSSYETRMKKIQTQRDLNASTIDASTPEVTR